MDSKQWPRTNLWTGACLWALFRNSGQEPVYGRCSGTMDKNPSVDIVWEQWTGACLQTLFMNLPVDIVNSYSGQELAYEHCSGTINRNVPVDIVKQQLMESVCSYCSRAMERNLHVDIGLEQWTGTYMLFKSNRQEPAP